MQLSRFPRIPALAASAAALLLFSAAGHAQSVAFRTVVLTDDQPPGFPMGVGFNRFDSPRINERGLIAFWAKLAGDGITEANDGSIWIETGGVSLAYQENDPAPFALDVRFDAFPMPAINKEGDLSFSAALIDFAAQPHPINVGIFAEDQGNLLVIAREGFSAPGLPIDFENLPIAPFNRAGMTAFHANTGAGIWSTRGGPLDLVAASGDPAGGAGPAYELSFLDNPVQNASGTLAFRATVHDEGEPEEYPQSLWLWTGGSAEMIAWADPSAPPPGSFHFTDFSIAPGLTLDGTVLFWASIAGDGIGPGNDAGLWRTTPGGIEAIIMKGDAAPGTDADFSNISRQLAHTPWGQVAFAAFLDGPGVTPENNSGIWATAPDGTLSLIAREGDQAPGLPAGAEFAILSDPVMNRLGQVAFTAQLRGLDMGENFALFATDLQGRLHKVARISEQFDVTGTGVFRDIAEIVFTHEPSESGYGQFNGRGSLVLAMEFDDDSQGVFEATVGCYADCDGDGSLGMDDFLCFQSAFLAAEPYADCDGSGGLDFFDFLCFQNEFLAGCP
jgi:hypothetical protein